MVTPRSMSAGDGVGLERLREAGCEIVVPAPGRQPTRTELLAALPSIDVWIAGVERIDAELLAAGPRLRAICRNGAGVDGIDVDAAAARGIDVLPARGANARGVAELALGDIIAMFRGILPSAHALQSGRWVRAVGRELSGAALGIVGYGAIGRILGSLAAGCGMRVYAYDPFVSGPVEGAEIVALDELLRRADAVSLHVPPQPGGPLIGADELASMNEGAVLVNTARAALVDQDAVLAALESGRLAGYAVDAYDVEPPEPSALLRHPRVVATPHLGAATRESIGRAAAGAVDNALGVLGRA